MANSTSTTSATAARSARSGYVPLAAICLAYLFNNIDKVLLAILQEPIKIEFGLSDSQVGALGLCFGVAYALGSFPLAYLADRGWAGRVVVATLGFWSAMTVACGLATNFVTLALGRAGVAFGEAGCAPAGHALISRIFPPHARATPMALMLVVAITGAAMANGIGGYIAQNWGWRIAFFILGGAGIVIMPLVALGLRPDRVDTGTAKPANVTSPTGGGMRAIRLFLEVPTLRYISIALVINSAAGYGVSQWIGSFLIRSYGVSVGEAGSLLLISTLAAGIIGLVLAGRITDALGARDERSYALVPLTLMVAGMMLAMGLALAQSVTVAVTLFGLLSTVSLAASAPVFTLIQRMAPKDCRATAAAIILLLLNLVGLGGGPLLFGLVSDMVATHTDFPALRGAFIAGSGCFLIASLFALLAAVSLRRDIADAPPA